MISPQWDWDQMKIAQAARAIRSKITAWWDDNEDERLDELVARNYENLSQTAAKRKVTAYQLVAIAARSSDDEKELTNAR
ncbi:MAG: hypothetical protein JWM58_599 [Rhizobium sp.]|nr:hypothetical protein [Rhizobium sp.]